MNAFKIALLVLIPFAGLVAMGVSGAAEELLFFGFLLWFILTAGLYWFSDKIVVKLCRAELLTVYHSPTIFRAVEELCKQALLPMPAIYMIPEQAPNICSVGRTPKNSGLLLTEGMLKTLSNEELRSAIAHELVHIYRRDTLLGGLASVFSSLLGMGGKTAMKKSSGQELSGGDFSRFAFSGILILAAPIAALVTQSLVNAKREFRADELAAKMTGKPLDMANAIRTMEKKKYITPMHVVPAVSHMFLVSPLQPGRIARQFALHPPMEERIKRLEAQHKSMPS